MPPSVQRWGIAAFLHQPPFRQAPVDFGCGRRPPWAPAPPKPECRGFPSRPRPPALLRSFFLDMCRRPAALPVLAFLAYPTACFPAQRFLTCAAARPRSGFQNNARCSASDGGHRSLVGWRLGQLVGGGKPHRSPGPTPRNRAEQDWNSEFRWLQRAGRSDKIVYPIGRR